MRLARGELEAMNDSLRMNPPGSVKVASLGVRDVEPLPGLSESAATTSEPATGAYRVSEGDTLWRLAQNYGITVDELLAVNPNLGPDGRIRTGEVIRVPMPERTGTGAGNDEVVTIVIPPPQGSSAPPAGAPSAGAQARSEEGWGSFLEGAIKGDFSDNDSWSKTAGQVVAGVVPFAGQAADARDTLAALNQVREGRPGGWLSLLAAGVGWFPGAGDALKGAIRGGKKVAGEAAEAALEQGARRLGNEVVEESEQQAARWTSDAAAAGTISPSGTAQKPYSNPRSRPKYSEGQVDSVWDGGRDAQGRVVDPNTKEELVWNRSAPRRDQWDMGHIPGEEYRRLHKDYMDGKITLDELKAAVRDPKKYRPEAPGPNRSRRFEKK